MNSIKNLKISQKLLVLICLAVFFVATVGYVGYYFNQKASNDITTMYKDRLLPIKWLNENRTHIRANEANLLYLILTNNPYKRQQYLSDINTRTEKFNNNLDLCTKTILDSAQTEDLARLKEALKTYISVRQEVIRMVNNGQSTQAFTYFVNNNSSFQEATYYLIKLTDSITKTAEDINTQNVKNSAFANAMLVIINLIALILLVAIGLMVSNMITRPITIAVEALGESSDQVTSASGQLSGSSQQLAEGSAEQAASIEETSSTLEESASMVRQNTENTKQAAILAKNAKDAADKGTKKMQEMMTSMSELKKSSDEIAKIIKVIDEIAFQTNILALNAAVEAARAGEAGMGFAVVAEEVRNLAQRSAQAAKDTAAIIESNIHLSEQGIEVSGQVNDSLVEIDNQAHKVSELLDEVAAASQEQSQGITQINKAISQMEQVVQANASTAEESASAAQELSAQAVNMKEIVNSLVALVNGANYIHQQVNVALTDRASQRKAIPKMNQRFTKTQGNKYLRNKNTTKTVTPEDVIPLEDDTQGF